MRCFFLFILSSLLTSGCMHKPSELEMERAIFVLKKRCTNQCMTFGETSPLGSNFYIKLTSPENIILRGPESEVVFRGKVAGSPQTILIYKNEIKEVGFLDFTKQRGFYVIFIDDRIYIVDDFSKTYGYYKKWIPN